LGVGINKDIEPKKQEARGLHQVVTSPAVHKEMNLHGAGSYLRKSELTTGSAREYPFLP